MNFQGKNILSLSSIKLQAIWQSVLFIPSFATYETGQINELYQSKLELEYALLCAINFDEGLCRELINKY